MSTNMGWEETALREDEISIVLKLYWRPTRVCPECYAVRQGSYILSESERDNEIAKAQAKAAYEAGQKEVVEYVDKNYPIGTPKWQARKKEWGLW